MTTISVDSEKKEITNLLSSNNIMLLQNIGNNVVFIEEENPSTNIVNSAQSFCIKKEGRSRYYVYTAPNVNTELTITKAPYQDGGGDAPSGDIEAGTGLYFDGNVLNHRNAVTPTSYSQLLMVSYDSEGHINSSVPVDVSNGLTLQSQHLGHTNTLSSAGSAGDNNTEHYNSPYFVYDINGHIVSTGTKTLKTNDDYYSENQTGLFTVAGAHALYNEAVASTHGYAKYEMSLNGSIEEKLQTLPLYSHFVLWVTCLRPTGSLVDKVGLAGYRFWIRNTALNDVQNNENAMYFQEAYDQRGKVLAVRGRYDPAQPYPSWYFPNNTNVKLNDYWLTIQTAFTNYFEAYQNGNRASFQWAFLAQANISAGTRIAHWDNDVIKPLLGNRQMLPGMHIENKEIVWFYWNEASGEEVGLKNCSNLVEGEHYSVSFDFLTDFNGLRENY